MRIALPLGTSRIALVAILGLAAALLVSPAVAPQPAGASPTFTIVDSPVDEVIDAAVGADGTLYAVGGFQEAGPATGGIARLSSSTAQVDRTFPTVNGSVSAMVVDGSGRTYLAGDFVSVAGYLRNDLARLNPDGSLDLSWAPVVTGPNAYVASLAVDETTVYFGGQFTQVNGLTRQHLAAVDTLTGDALAWAPNPNFPVSAVATDGSNLYVGGVFTSPATRIASYDLADLTRRSSWSPQGADQQVVSLVVDNGLVYVGGSFQNISGSARNGLAALNTSSGNATSWDPGITQYSSVSTIVIDDTTAYVGGNFVTVNGGITRNKVAALRTDDTGTATSWNPNLGLAGNVHAIAVTDTYVYLGGNFEYVNGTIPSAGFNRVSVSTAAVDGSWDPGMVTSNSGAVVYSVRVQDTTVIAAGGFTHMNVVPRNGAAAFDSQMRLTAWDPNIQGTPYAISTSGTSAYVVGDLYTVNGSVSRDYAAAFRTDDTGTVTSWDPQPDSYPYDMVIEGNLAYLVGDFGYVGGTIRNYAAAVRIDDAGTLTSWDPDLDSAPYSIALADGVAYMAGDFNSMNGGSVSRYTAGAVSIEDTGTATAWDPDPDSNAYGVTVANGIAYLVGDFQALKNTSTSVGRYYAAAITTEGVGTVTDWDPNLGGSSYDVVVSGDYAYLAGDFTDLNGGTVLRDGLAAVSLDDTGSASDEWVPLATGGFTYSTAYDAGLTLAGTRLLVSGNFPMATLDGVDYPGGLAALPLIPGANPVPPTPATPNVSSAPRDVQAVPGDKKAKISWKAPASSGSYPVTDYQVTAAPGGHGCLVSAPALTCEVVGLSNGTAYTFTVKALTGAGWSAASEASNAVVPRAGSSSTVVITGSREGNRIKVTGTSTGFGMGGELNPWMRMPGQSTFTKGAAQILVSVDGTFEWSRRSGKRISVYLATPDLSVRSNTVTIPSR